MNIIRTVNLSKKYKGKYLIQNVSLTVPEGSIVGLLGPNGAGKTTLLKLLIGMLSPTEGDVLFKNERLLPRHLCSIGSLIDNPALYENLTAEENLKVRTLPLGIETKTITEVLQTVHLSDTGNKKVKHFSLGMKQRLGIAIALVNHPEFLILDEPTNGLDPLGIKEFRNLMTTLHEKGITILLSSHILKEMECLADHVAILINGELKYQGVHRPGDDLETLFMSMI